MIPKRATSEKAAFIFAAVYKTDKLLLLQLKNWYPVQPDEYEYQSRGYVELKDEIRPKIIKMAFDLDAAIVELHSHLYPGSARFSPSDLSGFHDFVPHVWWRLAKKPYAAIVFSKLDFDALVWIDNPKTPTQLTEITVGKEHIRPNGSTLGMRGGKYGFRPF